MSASVLLLSPIPPPSMSSPHAHHHRSSSSMSSTPSRRSRSGSGSAGSRASNSHSAQSSPKSDRSERKVRFAEEHTAVFFENASSPTPSESSLPESTSSGPWTPPQDPWTGLPLPTATGLVGTPHVSPWHNNSNSASANVYPLQMPNNVFPSAVPPTPQSPTQYHHQPTPMAASPPRLSYPKSIQLPSSSPRVRNVSMSTSPPYISSPLSSPPAHTIPMCSAATLDPLLSPTGIPEEIKITSVLRYSSTPSLIHDVRHNPNEHTILVRSTPSSDPIPIYSIDLSTPATKPSMSSIRIQCTQAAFPWRISIPASNMREISISDVLGGLYSALHTQVSKEQMDMCPEERKERVHRAYNRRVQNDKKQELKGVKRVDFLGSRTRWCGLVMKRDVEGEYWDLVLKD